MKKELCKLFLAGHTRLKAFQQLDADKIECLRITGLTEEQKKKYRILDNKTNEFAEWNFDALKEEILDLDFNGVDFNFNFPVELDWDTVDEISEENYKEPDKKLIKCPSCGHVDSAERFMKVKTDI